MQIGVQDKEMQTVAWESGKVRLIDQTALPEKLHYVELTDWREVAEAIRTMIVRGAPAIGCTAALGMALGARGIIADSREAFMRRVHGMAETFRASRPTAVNLFWAVDRILDVAENAGRQSGGPQRCHAATKRCSCWTRTSPRTGAWAPMERIYCPPTAMS